MAKRVGGDRRAGEQRVEHLRSDGRAAEYGTCERGVIAFHRKGRVQWLGLCGGGGVAHETGKELERPKVLHIRERHDELGRGAPKGELPQAREILEYQE